MFIFYHTAPQGVARITSGSRDVEQWKTDAFLQRVLPDFVRQAVAAKSFVVIDARSRDKYERGHAQGVAIYEGG